MGIITCLIVVDDVLKHVVDELV